METHTLMCKSDVVCLLDDKDGNLKLVSSLTHAKFPFGSAFGGLS